ncbi:nickel pincer cofactor biosynthesis protein LarC [Formosa sediminum]|uniref:Nickel pincer cofactor biosynthesis protein LarC n=1 Tax=Formosa sediminum TaxID=2594004 RepID=A0A516GUG0_9FLAO|nr:nickel pincer cofactor biosynthesis protein LarC [Formosa sediminum]QDO95164.1 nickel pincer cofactor biosynthesis protein LarC [Formosa sediminum]
MNTIYIEAFSGLSGNMFLSAFSALLGDYEVLRDLPQKLHLPDGKIEIKQVDKNGINCQYVEVIDLNLGKEPDHDHSHSHSHEHNHDHGHTHSHNHAHTHAHNHSHTHSHDDSHTHEHSHSHGAHRHLSDIQKIIDHAHISDNAKKIAHDIFLMIGQAESKIHDMPLETIHFHEISGVDSIIDIVGNAVLIDQLNISKVYCTPICTGFGIVKTQHGMLPVPAPATAELLQGMPIYPGTEEGEKITPTGAAILKYLNPDFKSTAYTTIKTAYGPGKKNFHNANVVRISLLKSEVEQEKDTYLQLEASIDDMSPEYLGVSFQDGLLAAGAVDFSITQQLMKKGRFAFLLSVILPKSNLTEVANYIFNSTSTIGVRYYNIDRIELPRIQKTKQTPFGEVLVKESTTPTQQLKSKPEFDDVERLAKANNQSPYQVLNTINSNF